MSHALAAAPIRDELIPLNRTTCRMPWRQAVPGELRWRRRKDGSVNNISFTYGNRLLAHATK